MIRITRRVALVAAFLGPLSVATAQTPAFTEESRLSVHGKNERLSLENIEFGLRLYLETLLEMQGLGKSVNGEQ